MPDLIRTPAGWTYPPRESCPCGAGELVGWTFCQCVTAEGGGHPSWRCRDCDAVAVLGCSGAVPVLNEYGC